MESKNMDRPSFLGVFMFFQSPELISRKKWPPGPEAAVLRAIQGNVSKGSISNVMKLFIALGGVILRFTKKKL
jgi:hypothetical protein